MRFAGMRLVAKRIERAVKRDEREDARKGRICSYCKGKTYVRYKAKSGAYWYSSCPICAK